MSKLTNLVVKEFLADFEKRSEVVFLEEGKEKSDLIKSAKKRGILIEGSRDLGILKTIYAFTNKPNANGAILPKKEFLTKLPQIVGKPMNIGHNRDLTVGYYIDYKYIHKDNKVIAYAIFFKSIFPDVWEKAKDFRKKDKLSSSFEIWSPEEKRRYFPNGTYELHQMEMAGGALIFEEKGERPAFKDAKVLEIARKTIRENISNECLVCASKYNDGELIISGDVFKDSVKKNADKLQQEKEAKKVEPKVEDKKPVEKPTPFKKEELEKKVIPQSTIVKIKCSNCGGELNYNTITEFKMGSIKCPKCFAILDQTGKMLLPPQIKNFKVMCPSCKVDNWLILEKSEKEATIKCQSCNKKYKAEFEVETVDKKKLLDQFSFVFTGGVNCPQCSARINFSGISNITSRIIKCPKCKIEFPFDISWKRFRQITNIKEIDNIEKSSKKGGNKMEFKIELSKYHRDIDDFEKLEATLPADYGESTEVAKRLTTEQRNALPDSMFAVVVRVKDKRTGKMRKIRMFPINDKAHVRNALARLGQPAPQATLKRLGVSVEKTRAKILRRARQLKMTQLLERYKAEKDLSQLPKEVTTCVKRKVKGGMKPTDAVKECWAEYKKTHKESKVKETSEAGEEPKAKETPKATAPKIEEQASKETIEETEMKVMRAIAEQVSKELDQAKIKDLEAENAKLTKKVKLYEADAEKIIERRKELGDYAEDLTDEEILDDTKFENATLKKEKIEKEVEDVNKENSSEIVGDKKKDFDYHSKYRNKITKRAFPKQEKKG